MLTTLVVAALLVSGLPQDAPRVSARLSTTTASMGEPVILEVIVENASGAVEIGQPRFPRGLIVTGTQDYTEMQFSIPGGRRQTRRREFALYGNAPGRFRIPPVSVTVGNTTYSTNAVELQVSGLAAPRTMPSTDEAWLRATMQPETVFVGQQATLTVEAGFSEELRMRLTRPPAFDMPSPTGFWVQDVPGGVQTRLSNVGGQLVEIQSLQRAYFPLSAGRYALAPARAVVDVREGFLFAPETREIRSRSPRVVVLPLPERGQPRDFKGAVGSYTVRAFVQPDTISVGEAAQITVEVAGTGNLKAAPPPVLPTIPGIEQFAPTEQANVAFDRSVARGTKQFQWVVIPDRAGNITVPAVSYPFFDPATRSYRRVTTGPIVLVVRPGAAAADGTGATALDVPRPSRQPAALKWVRSRAFALAQLLPVLLLVGVALAQHVRRERARGVVVRLSELRRVAKENAPYPQFLRDVESLVRGAAADRVGAPAVRTAKTREIGDALRGAGTDQSLVARVVALIERLETQRFAPVAAEAAERQALIAEAGQIVQRLDRDKPAKMANARAVVALVAIVQTGSAPFDGGVALYRSGLYAQAATSFEAAVAADSSDVAAWANLGNAYFRAGDRGRAIWAWARAAREAPRDNAITRNLQAAGAVEVLRTRPPLSVRPVEWYLLAAVAWWAAFAIAIAALVRKRWSLLSWALPALAIVIVALAVGMLADGRKYAVAIGEQTRLYGDPTVHSPVVRTIQSGAGLDVIETRGDWLRVRTVTQTEGWVEADAVGRL